MVENVPEHDLRFEPILRQFELDAAHFGIDIKTRDVIVTFGDVQRRPSYLGYVPIIGHVSSDAKGICYVMANSKNNDFLRGLGDMAIGENSNRKVIVLDEEYKSASLAAIEAVLYHELGHCTLEYEHVEIPLALMNPTNFIYELGQNPNRYDYLRNFFLKEKSINYTPFSFSETEQEAEKIYEVTYEAFGQKISQKIYMKESQNMLYFAD